MGLSGILARVNWVDILILILLFRISYAGFYRGLGNEIIPLIGVFAALIIAPLYYLHVGNFVATHTTISSEYASLLSYIGLLFIIRYIVNHVELTIAGKVVSVHVAPFFDRLGGLLFGVIRAVLLISVLLIGLRLIPFDYIKQSAGEKSYTGKKFLKMGWFVHNKTAAFFRLK